MKKQIFSAIIILFFHSAAIGQKTILSFETGLGTYTMNDLKEMNDMLQTSIPFDVKLVSDFPPFLYYRPSIQIKTDEFNVGFNLGFQSTGSRISGKDYSGEYRFDIKVNAFTPSVFSETRLFGGKLECFLYGMAGIAFTNLKFSEYFSLLDTVINNDNYKFKAYSFLIEPGLKIIYPLGKIKLELMAGYQLSIYSHPFYVGDNPDNKLYNEEKRKEVVPGWNGVRIGLGIIYQMDISTIMQKKKW